jgi:hypothetical protein
MISFGGVAAKGKKGDLVMKNYTIKILFVATVTLLFSGNGAFSAYFGTYCQQDFEDGWASTIDQAWRHCNRFNNEMDDTDTRIFYRNLHSARDEFETDNDQNGLERVGLAYVHTHGGSSWGTNKAVWAMWDYWVVADSRDMWLGNENYGLSILASYACLTHTVNDGHAWYRWSRPFKGGMRYTVGSHGHLNGGRYTNECGREFADNLQDGDVIKHAWRKAVREPFVEQDATAIASGIDADDCHLRRDNMRWQNYGDYPRRRNDNMNHICWTWWDNL